MADNPMFATIRNQALQALLANSGANVAAYNPVNYEALVKPMLMAPVSASTTNANTAWATRNKTVSDSRQAAVGGYQAALDALRIQKANNAKRAARPSSSSGASQQLVTTPAPSTSDQFWQQLLDMAQVSSVPTYQGYGTPTASNPKLKWGSPGSYASTRNLMEGRY
jgi:hypothetical protein